MKRFLVVALAIATAGLMLALAVGCDSGSSSSSSTTSEATTSPGGHTILTPAELTDAAPGLGTIMQEIGQRNWYLYYSATGGNWDLAAYQAKELGEAMETGTITRPKHEEALDKFMKDSLDPLTAAIKAKDGAQFESAWKNEVAACNACHAEAGHKYIVWSLPDTPPQDLQLGPVS